MAQSVLGGVLSFIAEGVIVFAPDGSITLVNPHASLLLDRTNDELIGKNIDDIFPLELDSGKLTPDERIVPTLFTAKKVFTTPSDKTAYLVQRSNIKFPIFVSARSLLIENNLAGILVFRDISNEKELETYKKSTAKRLSELTPFLQRIATGDFSEMPRVPLEEDEFTELFVGLHLMTEDLQEAETQRKREQEEKIEAVRKIEEERRKLAEEYSKQLEKQVEEKTQEIVQAKTHTETIIENLSDGLIEYDNEFTLLRVNRAAEALLGVERAEVVGKKIAPEDGTKAHLSSLVSILYPTPQSTVRGTSNVALGSIVETHEVRIQYPLERELQIITIPIVAQAGKPQGLMKLIRDITREKNISRSKNEFISIAAHQLRTPLSAIKWTLDIILNGDEGPLTNSQRELLHNSYETNEKMVQLVNDLLNVARIEEGRFGYVFKECDIMTAVQNAIDFVRVTAQGKGVTVNVETPGGAPPPFVFDISKVTLALQNLVDNAVKYTPRGGRVTVNVSVGNDELKINIQDTGIGIPKNQISMLFRKFFRADNALRIQTSGSGMGLYLAKNIAVRHGGSLTVESKEGIGSTFSFTLPLNKERIPKGDILPEDI
ncbi:MAG: PAS domain S-box protein [Patescibacteria group bacterium]|nr:PAS domain S-box protein [Patescibacteria group bacterium]